MHRLPPDPRRQRGHLPHSTYEAGEKACIDCHGDDVEGELADWKETVDDALKKAQADLAKAEAAAKALTSAEAQKEAKQLLDDARHNLDLVRYGRGVHNVEYAEAVLEAVSAGAARVGKLEEAK